MRFVYLKISLIHLKRINRFSFFHNYCNQSEKIVFEIFRRFVNTSFLDDISTSFSRTSRKSVTRKIKPQTKRNNSFIRCHYFGFLSVSCLRRFGKPTETKLHISSEAKSLLYKVETVIAVMNKPLRQRNPFTISSVLHFSL